MYVVNYRTKRKIKKNKTTKEKKITMNFFLCVAFLLVVSQTRFGQFNVYFHQNNKTKQQQQKRQKSANIYAKLRTNCIFARSCYINPDERGENEQARKTVKCDGRCLNIFVGMFIAHAIMCAFVASPHLSDEIFGCIRIAIRLEFRLH